MAWGGGHRSREGGIVKRFLGEGATEHAKGTQYELAVSGDVLSYAEFCIITASWSMYLSCDLSSAFKVL